MSDLLFLRGAPAYSAFRLQGLQQRIQAIAPKARLLAADYWHFVKLNAELPTEARAQLAELLEERPPEKDKKRGQERERGQLFLITSRIGTISP